MPNFAIAPLGNAQVLAVAAADLNQAVVSDYLNPFSPYQRTFGVYERLTLTAKRKFTYRALTADNYVWQKHQPCSWRPTNNFASTSRDITPTEVDIMEELCLETAADGFFEVFKSFNENGSQIDPTIIAEAVRTFGRAAVSGALLQFAVGQVYEAEPATTTDARVALNFERTKDAVKGYVKGMLDDETGDLNKPALLATGDFTYAEGFTGDVLDYYDSVKRASPTALRNAALTGFYNGTRRVVWLVTGDIYGKVAEAFIAEQASVSTNGVRITERTFGTGENAAPYYLIDNKVVVVPDPALNGYDDVVDKRLVGSVLTVAGNLQFGFNFDLLATDLDTGVVPGLIVERPLTGTSRGKLLITGEALMSAGAASTQLLCAAFKTVDKPA